ncbi:hypothetical protein GQ651_03985 [Alphaproteobacteria bacterium GH1-50]|uniref:Tetratricopeptide repeat-like domain-containing protein n=1 Tax=Kangsaoukella pontilimi TaxID=2691042 RepID=A0A7C9J1Q8_9RHOB|nr:hypothetical protein [Kangsaoukella pontilimi]MXQ07001.1 hypothetical protein [Kangsaoukella pontilimi]
MSNQDSFINEVTEEVRRERLYKLFRRYGWIPLVAVVVIVGGAAINEFFKARAQAEAEAAGDALLAAFEADDAATRADALAGIDPGDNAGRVALIALSQATALVEAGDVDDAIAVLETLAVNPGTPAVYQELATLKAAMLGAGRTDPEARIQRLNGLVVGGSAFSLMALEQIALAEIEMGRTDAAIETLRGILVDASVTEDLRRRATQLIVSLGAPQAALAQ